MPKRDGTLHTLELSSCERDLGVMIASNLKWLEHCSVIASRTNRILGMLSRSFTSRDPLIWIKLYTSLVRPHLFASAA